jgi:glycosyltransferase involved in cell wall biosynthesis
MNLFPKVSVMVVTYNQVHLIKETFDSILSQDYSNMEIIVADDASTDGTQNILREYANRYPHKIVPVLNPQNLGITGNCNRALTACTGEFISLFAGDDLMLPGKISAQVYEFVHNADVTLCYHPVEIFESSNNKTLYVTFKNSSEVIRSYKEIIMGGGFPGINSVMVRRTACPAAGFDSRLPTVSDWMFIIEVALKGKVVKLSKVYSRYRKHQQGTTHNLLRYLNETIRTLDLLVEKHPERPELFRICQKGKARYIVGEAFRQLNGNRAMARELSRRALDLDPGNYKYRVLHILTRFEIVTRILGPFLIRRKYIIKRLL